MSVSSNPGAGFNVVFQSNALLSNSLPNDFALYTTGTTSRILMGISNNTLPTLILTSNGLGVATAGSNPQYTLDVAGDVKCTTLATGSLDMEGIRIRKLTGSNFALYPFNMPGLCNESTTTGQISFITPCNILRFATQSSNEVARWSGNLLGLGTTTPTATLEVADVTAGLVCHLPFENSLADATSNVTPVATGTPTTAPPFTTGVMGYALALSNNIAPQTASNVAANPATHYITVPAPMTTGLSFTITFWFRPTTVAGTYQTILSYGDTSYVGGGINVDIDGPNARLIVNMGLSGNWSQVATAASSIQANQWYHVVIAINQQTFTGSLYLNATPIGSVTGTNYMLRTTQFLLGMDGQRLRGYTGLLDDFRLYNRLLTPTEIASIHKTTALRCSKNLQIAGSLGINTTTPPQASLHVAGPLWAGPGFTPSASATTLQGGPFIKQSLWDAASNTHILALSNIAPPSATTLDNVSGTLHIYATNKTSKNATAQVMYLKTAGSNIMTFNVASFASSTITTFAITTPSASNIQVSTDADMSICWTSMGAF